MTSSRIALLALLYLLFLVKFRLDELDSKIKELQSSKRQDIASTAVCQEGKK